MLNTIRLAGAGYLAVRAIVAKAKAEADTCVRTAAYPRSASTPSYSLSYVDAFANATSTLALAVGSIAIAPMSGPVGIVLATKDCWLRRAEIRKNALAVRDYVKTELLKRTATVRPLAVVRPIKEPLSC